MILGFNHVGVVVKDAEAMIAQLEKAAGAKVLSRVDYPEMGQTSYIVSLGDQKLEVMTTCGEVDGTVSKFLKSHGEGLHHISLKTNDFEVDCAALEAQGVKIFGKQQIEGHNLGFAHPKTTGGILYEIHD